MTVKNLESLKMHAPSKPLAQNEDGKEDIRDLFEDKEMLFELTKFDELNKGHTFMREKSKKIVGNKESFVDEEGQIVNLECFGRGRNPGFRPKLNYFKGFLQQVRAAEAEVNNDALYMLFLHCRLKIGQEESIHVWMAPMGLSRLPPRRAGEAPGGSAPCSNVSEEKKLINVGV